MEFGRDFDQPIGEAFELSSNVLVSELAAIGVFLFRHRQTEYTIC